MVWEVSVTDKELLEAELEIYKNFEAQVRRAFNSVDIDIALNTLKYKLEKIFEQSQQTHLRVDAT